MKASNPKGIVSLSLARSRSLSLSPFLSLSRSLARSLSLALSLSLSLGGNSDGGGERPAQRGGWRTPPRSRPPRARGARRRSPWGPARARPQCNPAAGPWCNPAAGSSHPWRTPSAGPRRRRSGDTPCCGAHTGSDVRAEASRTTVRLSLETPPPSVLTGHVSSPPSALTGHVSSGTCKATLPPARIGPGTTTCTPGSARARSCARTRRV